MSIGAVARRIRVYGGQFLLLAALTMVVTLLISGVPRLVNWRAEQGLRTFLASQPAERRDVTYSTEPLFNAGNGTSLLTAYEADLERLQAGMPPDVRRMVDQRWFTAETEPGRVRGRDLAAKNLLVDLGLRSMPGIAEAGTLTEGRWPDQGALADQPVQVALAADVARKLNLRAGSQLTLAAPQAATPEGAPDPVRISVVGVFEPRQRADGIWQGLPQILRVIEPQGDGQPFVALGVVDGAALDRLSADGWGLRFSWRYRLGADSIEIAALDRLIDSIQLMGRQAQGRIFVQGLDIPLREFKAELAAARTVLVVIATGVLAALAGLVVLAAGLTVRRRRTEFTLLRARGGTATIGARRSLAESFLVVLPAAAFGWLLGNLAPGSPGDTAAFAAVAAILVTLALPVATLVAPTGVAVRRDLIKLRPSARRITVEASLLLLAVLAVVLLRRRGLILGEVDPLLVSVPMLLAVAAAVLAVRLYPWPLRLLSRLAARTRGSVAFLGTARAGRAVVTTPLVVVVLAVATAAFCAVVAGGIEASRDGAASRQVPADALIQGERLAPETGAELERLPGVRAASPVLNEAGQRITKDAIGTDPRLGTVSVVLVDGPALASMVRETGVRVSVPSALLTRGAQPGPLPAVVSPAVAAELAAAGLDRSAFVAVQGQRYEFRVAGRAESFPMLRADNSRFVILPWQSLPRREYAALPTGFLVAGDDLDVEELRRVGNEGQSRFQQGGTVTGRERPLEVEVRTWAEIRRQLGEGRANGVLVFGFVAGAAAGTALGLLAIAFVVLAGARARGQVLSRLRTLGLSRRQWRGLLLVELGPLVGVSVLTGALVGALLPLLLTPVLGLSAFTNGAPVRVPFEPRLVAGIVALGAVALGFAVAVEALNNRRMRLGEVLRLGEES
ncbi:putative ABC transport system permease protein [Micromonospora rhizosphaerae]|uniref:Putative ABC transport system permease protein n=1 Tax=Micromonospora rhizosphaerae TaxID=568872 RepID=A0A1C6RYN5_9ACTN|nr:FtsX-like permease family protein [Micromonospora rhizosphaerae]SCL22298.1 putative ABC transport system permease protein [Micromonospora rhizosphaerae]